MKKMLIVTAVLVLIGMIIGSRIGYGGTQLGLLIDDSLTTNIIRIAMIIGLITISMTFRPRSATLRLALGTVALAVAGFVLYQFASYSVAVLDFAISLLTACILGVEALEDDIVAVPNVQKTQSSTS